jgi:hypothetical protein
MQHGVDQPASILVVRRAAQSYAQHSHHRSYTDHRETKAAQEEEQRRS